MSPLPGASSRPYGTVGVSVGYLAFPLLMLNMTRLASLIAALIMASTLAGWNAGRPVAGGSGAPVPQASRQVLLPRTNASLARRHLGLGAPTVPTPRGAVTGHTYGCCKLFGHPVEVADDGRALSTSARN